MTPAEAQVYLSFDEAPVDDYDPALDGDNSLLADAPWANPKAPSLSPAAAAALHEKLAFRAADRASSLSAEATLRRIVPHPRDLHFGSIGWDVLALQRALAAAHLRRWGSFTRVYGAGTRANVRRFQQTHGLHVDGIYGVATHRRLGAYYDARGIWLLNRVHILTPAQAREKRLLAAAQILYNRRAIVHYTEGSERMWIVRNHYKLSTLGTMAQDWEDCSSTVTGIYDVAELADPNDLHFNGQGWTGSLAENGVSITVAQASIGALYLYGPGFPYKHVTMNVGADKAISMGSEPGPFILAPRYRSDLAEVRRYPGLP